MNIDEIKVGDRVRVGDIPDKAEFLDLTRTSADQEYEVFRIVSDPESESGKAAVICKDPLRLIDPLYLEKVGP